MFDNVLDKESKAIYLGNPSIKSVENSTLGGGVWTRSFST